MDYSNRKILAASVNSLTSILSDGRRGVTADVGFDLSGEDGVSEGPGLNVQLTVDLPDDGRLDSAEKAVLAAALAVLRRVADEPLQSIEALHLASRRPAQD